MAGQKRHHVNHELTEQIKLFNWARADNFDLVNCEEAQKWMGKCCGYDYEWTPSRDCAIYCGDIDRE